MVFVLEFEQYFCYFFLNRYWPDIDDALRTAVVNRNVKVRLLISQWNHTKPMSYNFLRSLLSVNKFKKNAVLEVVSFK